MYPGTYGISPGVGSPGVVGSVGWFGYGFGVISVPSGGVTPFGKFGTQLPNFV